jgi:AAA15 family ATPase/GTPase
MTIKKLIIENFKGISERTEFEIKPITLFCGPNSSGKSSCLHALTALSQTTKISASHMPIILDDEYAHVHLGRFMDVIHDKNPESSFSIGIEFECILNKSDENSNEDAKIGITFKAKPHSQEIYISKSEIKFQKENIVFSRINEDSIGFKVDLNKKQLNIDAQESKSNKFSMQLIPDFDDKEISTENFFKLYLDLEKINQSLNTNLRNTFYLGPFRQ